MELCFLVSLEDGTAFALSGIKVILVIHHQVKEVILLWAKGNKCGWRTAEYTLCREMSGLWLRG